LILIEEFSRGRIPFGYFGKFLKGGSGE